MVLAIDPGLHKMGLAYFNERSRKLEYTEVVKANGNLDKALMEVRKSLTGNVITVVIEEPQQFLSSRKGMAASNSGAVVKLIALVYSIREMAIMMKKKIVLAPVIRWKGQVPKEIVWKRLRRRGYKLDNLSSDEKDAVGIGVWYFEECEE